MELDALTVQELEEKAEGAGLSEELIDMAMDAQDPKAMLIKLLQAPPEEQAAESQRAAAGASAGRVTLRGTRVDTWGKFRRCKAIATGDGDPDAQYWLGVRYMEGRTPDHRQDHCEGLRWLRCSAAQGNYEAQCRLGKWYNARQVRYGKTATADAYRWRPGQPKPPKLGNAAARQEAAKAKAEAEAQAAKDAAAAAAAEEDKKVAAQKAAAEKAAAVAAEAAAAEEAVAAEAAKKAAAAEAAEADTVDGAAEEMQSPGTDAEDAAADGATSAPEPEPEQEGAEGDVAGEEEVSPADT
jgi:hypothetical protein